MEKEKLHDLSRRFASQGHLDPPTVGVGDPECRQADREPPSPFSLSRAGLFAREFVYERGGIQ